MYPQAKSSKSVLEGQEFFRLYTPIESNGDIYEIDTSVKAICIGPNSDVQNVRVWYYDVQALGQVESAVVSIADPFITRMNAFMAQDYPGLGTRARVLVTSDDLVPHSGQPLYTPWAADPDPDTDLVVWYRPHIDVLCYHVDPPSLPVTRGERQWQSTVTIRDRGQGTGYSWWFFPHYRRKYFHVRILNPILQQGTHNFSILGLTFQPMPIGAAEEEFPAIHTDVICNAEAILGGSFGAAQRVVYADQRRNLVSQTEEYSAGYYDYICLLIYGDAVDGSDEDTLMAFDVISTDWA